MLALDYQNMFGMCAICMALKSLLRPYICQSLACFDINLADQGLYLSFLSVTMGEPEIEV